MPPRRRPTAEFDATQSEAGPRIVTLDSPIGGYNGYTSPDLLSPKFWKDSSNVYAGQFGVIRRARWAPIVTPTSLGVLTTGQRIASMFSYSIPGSSPVTLFDPQPQVGGLVPNPSGVITSTGAFIFVGVSNVNNTPLSNFNGPFMRLMLSPAMILQANGIVRTKLAQPTGSVVGTYDLWGIDAPDSSPSVALISGSTATIQAAPTGAARTSNIATITTTAAHG